MRQARVKNIKNVNLKKKVKTMILMRTEQENGENESVCKRVV